MAPVTKPALWCVLALMFTLTVLVYISPSKPSTRTVLNLHQDGSMSDAELSQHVQAAHYTPDEFHRTVPKHVSIASSSLTLPQGNESSATAKRHYEDDAAFLQAQKDIQNKRRSMVDRVCKKYHPNAVIDVVKQPPWNILVDDKYKLMYCYAQKVACTNWKKVFLVLSGKYNTTESIPQFFTNRQGGRMLKSLEDYSETDRRRILRDYTKFMFARHPFSRVLSAYRNKLAPDSTFVRASKWQRKIGLKIISAYRQNAGKLSAHNFSQGQYDLTFDEFLKFVISPPSGLKGNNKHWRDLHISCLPCLIKYDVIGKMETIVDDARFILTLSGAKDVVHFPSAEGSSPTNSSNPDQIQSYFANLPTKDITALYKRYLIDFLMFDYHATVDGVLDVR